MKNKILFIANIIIYLFILHNNTIGSVIKPANPNASANAKKVLTYLYDLPKRSEDRLSGPYGCGTPASIKDMYTDPIVVNRGEIDWKSVRMHSEEAKP